MTISEIRAKYTSAGDIIFRSAVGWLMEVGANSARTDRPEELEMIEDYVKACAADIAESPEFDSRIADAFKTDRKVYLVYCESDRVGKEVQSIHQTYESAIKAYSEIRKQIAADYNLNLMEVEEDDYAISASTRDGRIYVEAYVSAKEVEEWP